MPTRLNAQYPSRQCTWHRNLDSQLVVVIAFVVNAHVEKLPHWNGELIAAIKYYPQFVVIGLAVLAFYLVPSVEAVNRRGQVKVLRHVPKDGFRSIPPRAARIPEHLPAVALILKVHAHLPGRA
ncbi:uncharacterized protein LMH87_008495 [Akanthomyces muscarius]|uniref:Uncharacterized protein n=1 Tax=Akanthomyces muscarius TaxID=2231603 RepID=A0A9W8UPQ0_AKAMU|nr:uncharacterized protein LMH87_008495 [Akanthomyces muscarius]KAJ4157943.1 hypothetical protein LMH87_008495 [Akanthomyces muscarius]